MKKIIAGWKWFLAAAVLVAGLSVLAVNGRVGVLSALEDPVMSWELNPQSVPLNKEPAEPEVKTTKSTKTSKKKVTTKTAAPRTYTKNLGTTHQATTKTVEKELVKTNTVTSIDVTTTEKYTRGSHIKEVTTKTVTTVTVTRTALEMQTPSAQSSSYEVDARTLVPMMDDRVLSAFQALGFSVVIDPSYTKGEGVFDPKSRKLTMVREDGSYLCHELGHFLSFLLDDVASSKGFVKIYKEEKDSFAGAYQEYAKANSREFFAECMREYFQNRTKLKGWCPKAFKVIRSSLEEITAQTISAVKAKYKTVWSS